MLALEPKQHDLRVLLALHQSLSLSSNKKENNNSARPRLVARNNVAVHLLLGVLELLKLQKQELPLLAPPNANVDHPVVNLLRSFNGLLLAFKNLVE